MSSGHVSGNGFFGHHIKRIDAVDKRSAGTESNKSIHIRSFMKKPFEAAYKEFLVDDHYDSGKKKLGKTYGNAVFRKKFRKRPAPHGVAHGNIHQSRKKTERSNKAFFKNGGLLILKSIRLVLFFSFFFGFKRSAVAGFFHRGNYFFRFRGAFNAHGICEKAYGAGSYAFHRRNGFFNPCGASSTAHSCYVILFHILKSTFFSYGFSAKSRLYPIMYIILT